jgi:hypothetical protein
MSWIYSQSTGQLCHNGEFITFGYSGIAEGLNNPADQDKPFLGPLPRCSYTIGDVVADGGHLGPYVMPLTPWDENCMFGRAGFYIHGDNQDRNHSASNGCIVFDRQWRTLIATSGDPLLVVVA